MQKTKILFMIMLFAIGTSITGYVYADSVTYSNGAVSQQADQVIYSASLSSTTDTITITWDAPEQEPKDYRVAWALHSGDYVTYRNMDYNAFPTDSSYTIEDLEEDTKYKIKIRARYHEAPPGPWTLDIPLRTESAVSTPEPQPTPDPDPTSEDHAAEMMQMQTRLNEAIVEMNRIINLITQLQSTLSSMIAITPEQEPITIAEQSINIEPLESYIMLNTTSVHLGDSILITGQLFPGDVNPIQYTNDTFSEPSIRDWYFSMRADSEECVYKYDDDAHSKHEHDDVWHSHGYVDPSASNHFDDDHGHYCTYDLDDHTFSMEFTIDEESYIGTHNVHASILISYEDQFGNDLDSLYAYATNLFVVSPPIN